MALFKCKMCGGTLEINNNESVATCEYCGTQQTLPKLDDDKRVNLYDRANHFRRNNEFDKASAIYEQILNEDGTDAEAYWSLVLCRYGIEYVEDPASHKRVPTVNRAQFTSIFDDDNYKSALQYADGYQKSLYEEEAKAINEIQKGILAISQKEEPFDVFICYKETDNNGRRTPDSVLANDLYHQLTNEGFKVFFSRITLEDKLGSAYEPYIFAALNSAKVMVALGTKAEYFNAVWVKNEWSRYLALIKGGAKKMLIPAYRDMDPYDLPEEFSHLQAQDMSKLGFMQDLIRGIKKIAQADTPKATVVKETVISGGNANTAPLLKRAFMFLEDGDWNSANEYCEKVLDIDPENASAYLGKLLSELRVRKQESLKDQAEPFADNNNYQKAIRFADDKLKNELIGYIEHINTRNENARLDDIYTRAKNAMSVAHAESDYKEAAHLFESIDEYQDSAVLAQTCYKQAEIARKDTILSEGKSKMTGEAISNYEAAIKLFESISGWKDADEQIIACQKKIEEIKAKRLEAERKAEIERKEAEKRAKRNKKIAIITTPIVCVVIAFIIVLNTVIIPNSKYHDAVALMDAGNSDEAYSIFRELGNYKDSAEKAGNIRYNKAVALMNDSKYEEAIAAFTELDDFKDSEDKVKETKYNWAVALHNAGDNAGAIEMFTKLGTYKDSAECKRNIEISLVKSSNVGDYVFFGTYEQDNNTQNGKEDVEWLVLAKEGNKVLVISKYALDCQQYKTSNTDVTWETCSLRMWLNGAFIDNAFSAEEQAWIPTVTVSADRNPDHDTDPGNATQDKVFLLSITEANQYFTSDEARRCAPTDYAIAQGADDRATCWWWLRSPGKDPFDAAYIAYHAAVISDIGGVDYDGFDVYVNGCAVRPALWITLDS